MEAKEFKLAVDNIVKEKDIDPNIVYDAMELALTSAYKKNFNSKNNVKVIFDRETGNIHVYSYLTVVPDDKMTRQEYEDHRFEMYAEDDNLDTKPEEDQENESEEQEETEEKISNAEKKRREALLYFNSETEIKLSDARKIDKHYEIGDTIDKEITPYDFGRVATSIAKQVVTQKIKEAERESILREFENKQDELLVGTVMMEDKNNYYIDLGRTNGLLPKKNIIPGEKIKMGSQIKVYVTKVEMNNNNPTNESNDKPQDKKKKKKNLVILLSRNHFGFVKRLFEEEIPELSDGTVMIESIYRVAGARTKIAVSSTNPNIDPVGCCIGEKGRRIANIMSELNGERLDVIRYDSEPENYIKNALSPAKELIVMVTNSDSKTKQALAIADGDNYKLAIGKGGQNVKLASKLTGYDIDVKTSKEASEMGIVFRTE